MSEPEESGPVSITPPLPSLFPTQLIFAGLNQHQQQRPTSATDWERQLCICQPEPKRNHATKEGYSVKA